MDPAQTDVTGLLLELKQGNQEAAERLIPVVYEELKRLARAHMRRERLDHTLQTTALVHEAYLKLVRQETVQWQGRCHFFGIAAQLMRQILAFSPEHSEELVRLDEALKRLSTIEPRQGKIVELRFFGGLSVEETSEFLGVSPKTVKRDWAVAKVWLHAEIRGRCGNQSQQMGTH